MNKEARIILFGGSFDPIHNGHIAMARCAQESLQADRVIFIPAARSPLKPNSPRAEGADRMAMIQIAIEGISDFEVSDAELTRPGPSYTIDTVHFFRTRYGKSANLYWLVGADALAELPFWYRIGQLMEDCQLCLMYRAGHKTPSSDSLRAYFSREQADRLAKHIIKTPLVDISSTQIRKVLQVGGDVSGLVPRGVADYIHQKKLYFDQF